MNPAIVLYSMYICTIVHVCPVPVPGVENIVIFLVFPWVRGERLLTSPKKSKAFFLNSLSQTFDPHFLGVQTTLLNCTQFAEMEGKKKIGRTKQNGRELLLMSHICSSYLKKWLVFI
jgi:hypothetical protein